VLVDGELTWYLERGGRSLLAFGTDGGAQSAAATALVDLVGAGRLQGLLVERINGVGVLDPGAGPESVPVKEALVANGVTVTPRGLRLR
jgi:ATP-dependent helicase Lhr and Lhr-like helicase